MPLIKLDPLQSALIVIDIQPTLSKTIFEIDRVLESSIFLAKVARLLEIPVFATEQNPTRMGETLPELQEQLISQNKFPKMAFSACGCPAFMAALEASNRKQVVLVGLETHICVTQTGQDLLRRGYEVVVCPDAVSARSQERHKLGMERIRDAGIVPAHTESVAYEWIGSADHERFKSFLQMVKDRG